MVANMRGSTAWRSRAVTALPDLLPTNRHQALRGMIGFTNESTATSRHIEVYCLRHVMRQSPYNSRIETGIDL
jgi:hypothetical protein